MTEKPILYILMEIKTRELEGRSLLAFEAAIRGYRVVTGNQVHLKKFIKEGLLAPGIYFDKSLTRGKEKQLQHALDSNCILVSQDEEGGLLDSSFEKFLSVRSTEETLEMASTVCCWGTHDHESWTKTYPNAAEKVHVTGSPRVDFWRPDFADYFREPVEKIVQRFGQFVLISSNFALANSYQSVEQLIAQGRENGSLKNTEDEKEFLGKIEDSRRMFGSFVEMANTLASRHPELNFVVRPHPAEKISSWTERIAQRKNLHVLFEGGITPWVRAATAIIHNGCTTGIEAYAMDTPPIAYVPFDSPINREIPNRLSISRRNVADISTLLSKLMRGEALDEHKSPDKDQLIAHRMTNIQGPTAASKIVDVLDTLDIPRIPPVGKSLNGWRMEKDIWIKRMSNRWNGTETKSDRKFPYLKRREIAEVQRNLARIKPEYARCKINHLHGDVFIIDSGVTP